MNKHKSRIVACVYSLKYGEKITDTYSPTVTLMSICVLLAIANHQSRHLHSVDVTSSFLSSELKEEVFMQAPDEVKLP